MCFSYLSFLSSHSLLCAQSTALFHEMPLLGIRIIWCTMTIDCSPFGCDIHGVYHGISLNCSYRKKKVHLMEVEIQNQSICPLTLPCWRSSFKTLLPSLSKASECSPLIFVAQYEFRVQMVPYFLFQASECTSEHSHWTEKSNHHPAVSV